MNFRTLDLNLLRVFDTVMVERNVTRAAAQLAMSQPAASNALRRLREAVGEDLFVPGPAGVTPTPHAASLWPAVREALAGLQEAFEPQDFDPREGGRLFTMLMADATASVLVPPLLSNLERLQARVELRVEPLTSRDPRAPLERGSADIAVGFFPDVERLLAASGDLGDFRLDELYRCEYVCTMRRGHPLALKPEFTLDDYCGARHARVNFAGRPHGFVDEALTRLGRSRRVALTLNHFSTAARVVRQTDLLSVFPRSYVEVSGVAGDVEIRTPPFELPLIEVGLLWHRRRERDVAHRWLRRMVAAATPAAMAVAAADPPEPMAGADAVQAPAGPTVAARARFPA